MRKGAREGREEVLSEGGREEGIWVLLGGKWDRCGLERMLKVDSE